MLLEIPRGCSSSSPSARLLRVRVDLDANRVQLEAVYHGIEKESVVRLAPIVPPSGDFYISSRDVEAERPWRVVRLGDATALELPGLEPPFGWLRGGLLVWLDSGGEGEDLLRAWDPAGGVRILTRLPLAPGTPVSLTASPDRRRVLVPDQRNPRGRNREKDVTADSERPSVYAAYDPDVGQWDGPHPVPERVPPEARSLAWANPSRLWLTGPGYAALLDPESGRLEEILKP